DITFPTENSVRQAFDAVRRFGGYCAGAIFFRWPNRHETLSFSADEVSQILSGSSLTSPAAVEARDGNCPSRRCTDLFLRLSADPATPARNIRVKSSGAVDLFLSDGPLRPRWTRAGELLVNVPAYSGLRSVYLGRALSQDPLQFEVMLP